MTDNVIVIHSKKVLLLEYAIEKGILPDPDLADIWIVNHSNHIKVKRFLSRVIRANDIKTYLKPIFLQKEFKISYGTRANHLKRLSDGYIKGVDFLDKIPMLDGIQKYITDHLERRSSDMFKTERDFIMQKCFDFYYTRKRKFKPLLDHRSLSGYAYPRLEAYFFEQRDAFISSRMILQIAFNQGWISRLYLDTHHLCSNCSGGFLNFREVCPSCGEHNLKVRSLIHHFRCAYVGIETDFEYKNKLVCPKCSTELKNLGVDYDKPGKVYHCKNKKCLKEFQEAPIGVHCVDCDTEQPPEDLVVRKVYEYELTTSGIQKGLSL